MNKYEEFDNSMAQLKKIEQELNSLSNSDNVSLNNIMQLRESATNHYKICNDVLKEIKETSKQNTNEQ